MTSFAGKSDEQRAAAALASVLCIQLGPGIESEEVLKTLGPVLKKIICDGTASIQARQTVSIEVDLGMTLTPCEKCSRKVAFITILFSFGFRFSEWIQYDSCLKFSETQ